MLVRLHDSSEHLAPLVGNSGACLAACPLQGFESRFGFVAQWNLLQKTRSLFGMTIQLAGIHGNRLPRDLFRSRFVESGGRTIRSLSNAGRGLHSPLSG